MGVVGWPMYTVADAEYWPLAALTPWKTTSPIATATASTTRYQRRSTRARYTETRTSAVGEGAVGGADMGG